MNENLKEFPIVIYGNFEKFNETLSKARVRIFYKYENRNGTFITDEFAEELLKSLPYAPVKGIYDGEDYTDHGASRQLGRIYGIVPEKPNIQWEKHLDEDGIEREYACADVLIFSALYKEANDIVGKAQSMELYEPSLVYHTAVIRGQKYLVFDHGCFLGLQVLGDTVEPCFEGASFYTLAKTIEDAIQKIKEYSKGEQSEMRKINFKLSDDQKFEAIWKLLNPEYTEEGEWTCSYIVCDVYDQYAIAFNCETGKYARVYYTKDDEKDMVTLDEIVEVYVIDVTESEKNTIETLRHLNGDTYDLVSENLINAEKNANDCVEYESKIEELNTSISTLNRENEEKQSQIDSVNNLYAEAQNQVSTLSEQVETLNNYKHSIEIQQKEAVIMEYSDKLSEEVINTYKEKIEDYSVIELDKELAYELKKINPSAFTNTQSVGFIPKDIPVSSIETILSQYEK